VGKIENLLVLAADGRPDLQVTNVPGSLGRKSVMLGT